MDHLHVHQQSPRTASEMLALFTPGSRRKDRRKDRSEGLRHQTPEPEDMFAKVVSEAEQVFANSGPSKPVQKPLDLSGASPAVSPAGEYVPKMSSEQEEQVEVSPGSTFSERSLRPRESLRRPSTSSEFVQIPPRRLKQTPKTPSGPRSTHAHAKISEEVANASKLKRNEFLLAHRDLFASLLPEKNYLNAISNDENNEPGRTISIVPREPIERQPQGVVANLKPYQLDGLSFLVHMHENYMNCILGDEMGLGKTLQILSLFQYIKENRSPLLHAGRPFLVVCPLTLLNHWVHEAQRFTPGLEVATFYGAVAIASVKKTFSDASTKVFSQSAAFCLVVTTYETFVTEQNWLKRAVAWSYVVLDEGHRIKSAGTLIAKALQNVKAEHRVILTGTPLQNNLHEMWSLFHWLYPEVFTERTEDIFRTSFDLSRGKVSTAVLEKARHLLELIMLRRMKHSPGVDLNLPPKNEVLLLIPLTPMQKNLYTQLLTGASTALIQDVLRDTGPFDQAIVPNKEFGFQQPPALDGTKSDKKENFLDKWQKLKDTMQHHVNPNDKATSDERKQNPLLNLIMQLRKCCSHPYLFPDAAPDPYYLGEHIIQASGKTIVLAKLIEKLVVEDGKKVLIFSGMMGMLDRCEELMDVKSLHGHLFKYVRLDGSTSTARRNLHIRLFGDTNSAYKVFLISIRAGGLGLNLVSATEVVFMDEDWNPQQTIQAESRAHRIGQTKPVTVYKLCTQGTVEEQMLGRIRKKLYLSAKITESMENVHRVGSNSSTADAGLVEDNAELSSLGPSQLKSLLRRGTQTLSHHQVDVTEMLSWDWPTTLEKCKDQLSDPTIVDLPGSASADEETWLKSKERVECANFDGKVFKRKREEWNFMPEISDSPKKRAKKERTIKVETDIGTFSVSRDNIANENFTMPVSTRIKKPQIENQQYCQTCWIETDEIHCSHCPRSHHFGCLSEDYQDKAKSKLPFVCPQHRCYACHRATATAGGLLFRCRWCDCAYCEDCVKFDRTDLIGDVIPELQHIGFGAVAEAFWIRCYVCRDHHSSSSGARAFFREQEEKFSQLKRMDVPQLTETEETAMNMREMTPALGLISEDPDAAAKAPRNGSKFSESGRGTSLDPTRGSITTPIEISDNDSDG